MTDIDYDPKSIALAVAPKIPALLSMIGSSYIIYTVASDAKKRKKIYHRIMFSLSCCDFVTSIIFFLGTWMIPRGTVGQFGPVYGASGNHGTCVASGFLTQFVVSSPLYNATLSLYYLLMVRYNWKERDLVKIEPIIHGIPICFGLGTAIAAAALNVYGSVDWLCWINPNPPQSNTKIYQWSFLFGPLFFCVIFVTTAMILLYRAMRKRERVVEKYAFESSMNINASFAAASNPRRSTALTKNKTKGKTKCSTEIAVQGILYVGGFYICWFFPTLQRIIELTQETRKNYYPLQFLDSFLLPLQGLFNALVYLRPKFQAYRKKHPEVSCCRSLFRTTTNASTSRYSSNYSTSPVETDAECGEGNDYEAAMDNLSNIDDEEDAILDDDEKKEPTELEARTPF
jgi:hypothetical protein